MTNFIMPSTPNEIAQIANAVKEAGNSKMRIEAEQDLIKEIAATMKDEFKMAPKDFNRMVKIYVKQEYAKMVRESEDFQEMYEAIMAKTDPSLKED